MYYKGFPVEFKLNRGILLLLRWGPRQIGALRHDMVCLIVGRERGIPSLEACSQLSLRTLAKGHAQEPADNHFLPLHKTLAEHLIDRRFDEARRDWLAVAVSGPIVHDKVLVVLEQSKPVPDPACAEKQGDARDTV